MLRNERIALLLTCSFPLLSCSTDSEGLKSDLDPSTVDQGADDQSVPDAGVPDAAVDAMNDATSSRPDRTAIPVEPDDAGNCGMGLEILVRDFTEEHPDFEAFNQDLEGIVQDELGPDQKPVYASAAGTSATTGPKEFAQWYNDVPGINLRFSTQITFTEQTPGVFVYDNSAFFPVDDKGFGNGPNGGGGVNIPVIGNVGGKGEAEHNFLFTTEAHTKFTYRGGEKFTFRGDDDMWVFLNRKLAIDLGGTHSAVMAAIDLDAEAGRLGLVKGESYPMDIFHAERHTNQSNYRIETTIDLSCIENVPVI